MIKSITTIYIKQVTAPFVIFFIGGCPHPPKHLMLTNMIKSIATIYIKQVTAPFEI